MEDVPEGTSVEAPLKTPTKILGRTLVEIPGTVLINPKKYTGKILDAKGTLRANPKKKTLEGILGETLEETSRKKNRIN